MQKKTEACDFRRRWAASRTAVRAPPLQRIEFGIKENFADVVGLRASEKFGLFLEHLDGLLRGLLDGLLSGLF